MINVLIVEDNFGVRDTLKDFLDFYYDDLNILLAKNAVEGIERVNRQKINILITDQMMPDMKGSEFIKEVMPKLKQYETWTYVYSGQLSEELSVELDDYKEIHIIDKFTNPLFFKEIIDQYKLAHA